MTTSFGTDMPALKILYAGDSNLDGDSIGGDGHIYSYISALLTSGGYTVTEVVTAAGSQEVLAGGELAVGGSQYNTIIAATNINKVVLNCGAIDVFANPVKATYKSSLRATVDGIGTALGCPVILCDLAEFLSSTSGNPLSAAAFALSLKNIRRATYEVAVESSHCAGLIRMRDQVHDGGESFDGIHYRTSPTMRDVFAARCFQAIANSNFAVGPGVCAI